LFKWYAPGARQSTGSHHGADAAASDRRRAELHGNPSFLAAFDWALNEQCYEYSECGAYSASGSFLPAGKAVFDVEYDTAAPDCTQANQAHINAQQTDLDLVGAIDNGYAYTPCVPDSQATW
jgi:hypothetical protein